MAANIEQIFQDFILNKIREIEDLSEERGGSEEAAPDPDRVAPVPAAAEAESPRGEQDHHKKHRKHKKKKKKKKEKTKKKTRDKETRTESGSDVETESRRGTPSQTSKKHSEDHESLSHRHRSAGKKKKKKKRRKDEENSSDEESRQKQSPAGQTSVRRQEELPDIIPKQDSVSIGRGDEEGRGLRSSPPPSPPHSHSPSHSCSGGGASGSREHQRGSRSPSESRSQGQRTSPSSSEKKPTLDKPPKPSAPSPPPPPPPPLAVSSAHSPSEAGGAAETRGGAVQSSELSETIEEERAEKPAAPDSGTTDHQRATNTSQLEPSKTSQSEPSKTSQSEPSKHLAPDSKSEVKKKRKRSKSPPRSRDSKSSRKQRRSKSPHRSHRGRSRSKSPTHRKRSRSRSGARRPRRSRSRSASRSRKRVYSQRDRWKREPSHSPVVILRKNRSPPRKHLNSVSSPQRISDLDKEQLLEIAKANAAAMCAKAGMPIPASLRSTVMPLALPSMAMNAAMASMTAATVTAALSNIGTLSSLLPLPSITNKPPAAPPQPNMAALEEVRRKVAKQANSISIKEFTDKCRMIVDSTGELPVALPHVSDEEEDGKPFGESALREQKLISFSLNNMSVRPAMRSDVDMAKEFPVSSGSQHRKKEGESQGGYGEWVPVDKKTEKPAATSRKAVPTPPVVAVPGDVAAVAAPSAAAAAVGSPAAAEKSTFGAGSDNVFPDPLTQPVDITQAVTERIKAQRRLAENPYDVNAICMLSRAQEQVDAWAQSSTVPGLFTGSTGAQVLSCEELSSGGPQAWLKKDQFLRAAPVSGGVGEFLMRKMGWRTGEGLGRNREGTVEPIVIDFKVDRKGLVAEGEKPQKQTGGLVVTKDMMGKHPVSALIELCNKKRIMQPDFVMVHHSGPDHRKNFLFKVTVDGVDYQPQTASPNKKHAKAMAATVALQALGEVPADGPGLYTGPVFTAASTGPLFST